jgi:P4 family phage/plasmid primase-like protien
MNFVCSLNSKVVGALHKTTGKIEAGGDFSAFNSGWVKSILTSQEIADNVKQRNALCAWHLVDGKREKNNTNPIEAGLIIIDIDNQADHKDKDGNKVQKQEITWEEAKELEICKNYLSVAYDSPSATDNWPRFRLVFGLEKSIYDPDFYQWFVREIAKQIPGSDIRATAAVNLFYGAKDEEGILYVSDNFIPASKINEALKVYLTVPKIDKGDKEDVESFLESLIVEDSGVNFEKLLSNSVKNILLGEPVDDRSMACTRAVKEIIGWANWLKANDITSCVSALTVAHQAFYAIYQYPAKGDGKFSRIVESIRDIDQIQPSIVMASEHDELAAWLRLKAVDRSLFDAKASDEVKESLKQTKPKPRNSILAIEDFGLEQEDTPTPTPSSTNYVATMSTPSTPTQLINLQKSNSNHKFGENDVADAIARSSSDKVLYDSFQDSFFKFREEKGVWMQQDEAHMKAKIIEHLKTFVSAGLLPNYKSATVNSIYSILQGELLQSVDEGAESIFTIGRSFIPFRNGALDSDTMEFFPGANKDLYFRYRHPYDWDKNAKCPKFMDWLKECLELDQTVLIRAFCRALLTGYTAGERFLHLVGPGRTGKSTMQQLMMALAGYHGTQSTSLEQIENNKFETFNLIGKRLVLLADEANYNKRMDTLKKLTSASDTIRAEKKYGKDSIQFKPECLVCIASNEHISSGDNTSGLERRRLTIAMNKVVDPTKVRNLLNVFSSSIDGEFTEELSGIVTWALSMPQSEMRSVFASPVRHAPSLALTDIEALRLNNPFVAWIDECILYAPNSTTIIGRGKLRPSLDEQELGLHVKNAYTELYASYQNYCIGCGYRACSKPNFVSRVVETMKNILKLKGIEKTQKQGVPALRGLRIKPFDVTSDRAAFGNDCLPNPVDYAQNPSDPKWEAAFLKHDAQT